MTIGVKFLLPRFRVSSTLEVRYLTRYCTYNRQVISLPGSFRTLKKIYYGRTRPQDTKVPLTSRSLEGRRVERPNQRQGSVWSPTHRRSRKQGVVGKTPGEKHLKDKTILLGPRSFVLTQTSTTFFQYAERERSVYLIQSQEPGGHQRTTGKRYSKDTVYYGLRNVSLIERLHPYYWTFRVEFISLTEIGRELTPLSQR